MIPLPDAFRTTALAHRGLHDLAAGRPENSTEAFVAAVSHGYGIELDVQMSADNQAIVFHDYHLGRLTRETSAIRQRSAADIGAIALTGGRMNIPDLATTLDMVAGRVPVLIEIKDQDGALGPNTGALEHAIAKIVQSYRGPIAVMSFNPHSVAIMAKILPDTPRGLTTGDFSAEKWPLLPAAMRARMREIPDYQAAQAGFISHKIVDLTAPRVAQLKSAGADILCWTVKNIDDEVAARKIAHNITFQGYLPTAVTA